MKKISTTLLIIAILVAAWVFWPKTRMTLVIPARPTVGVTIIQNGELSLGWWAIIQTGLIIFLLLITAFVRPAWFKFDKEDYQIITFKRILGATATLCIGGFIWFAISSYLTAPSRHAAEDGRIQIPAYNVYTLIVPEDATVAGESEGEMMLTGPVTITAMKTEPRIGWPTGVDYFTIQFQSIPAGRYGISGVKNLGTLATVNVIEIRGSPAVFVQDNRGKRIFLPLLLTVLQAMFSYLFMAIWFYSESKPEKRNETSNE